MQDLHEAVKLLNESKRVMLAGSMQISYDELASLISLAMLLRDKEKSVSVCFFGEFTDLRRKLLERYEVNIQRELEPLSYTVSIPYDKGEVEKVSYDTKDGHVNLHITPGKTEFDFDSVKYSVNGSNFDAVVVVGARKLEWLRDFYTENKAVFDSTKVIALNNLKGGQEFGDLKLVDEKKQTSSEMVYELVSLLGGTQSEKIINCLLEGVLAGANLTSEGVISENTNTVIVSLISAGGDIKSAIRNYYLLRNEREETKVSSGTGVIGVKTGIDSVSDKQVRPKIRKPRKRINSLVKHDVGEPSKGYVAPPSIEKSAKIPLGAPITLKKASDN